MHRKLIPDNHYFTSLFFFFKFFDYFSNLLKHCCQNPVRGRKNIKLYGILFLISSSLVYTSGFLSNILPPDLERCCSVCLEYSFLRYLHSCGCSKVFLLKMFSLVTLENINLDQLIFNNM